MTTGTRLKELHILFLFQSTFVLVSFLHLSIQFWIELFSSVFIFALWLPNGCLLLTNKPAVTHSRNVKFMQTLSHVRQGRFPNRHIKETTDFISVFFNVIFDEENVFFLMLHCSEDCQEYGWNSCSYTPTRFFPLLHHRFSKETTFD